MVALMAAIAMTAAFALGGGAHEEATPAASPAPGVCQALAGGTPWAGMMAGSTVVVMPMTGEFDLMFIDMMVRHHQGAVAMAQVALERAEHQELRDFAQQMIDTQQAEIDQLRAWRDAWYPDAPEMPMDQMTGMMIGMMGMMQNMPGMTPGAGMDPGGMMGTPGAGPGPGGMGAMMSIDPAQMLQMMDPRLGVQALCNATGAFDVAFLRAMIPHHQMAVAMAQVALQSATHDELTQLAQAMIDAQQAEIAQMEAWLTEWSGDGSPATPVSGAGAGTVVTVAVGDMYVNADLTEFEAGVPYVFVVTNEGKAPHDFVIEVRGTGHRHDHATGHRGGPNAIVGLQPGETRELAWTFAEPGEYELVCRLPGHYEAGMRMVVRTAP
jgi:uncharacterized protein (DUF305 family)